MKLCFLIFEQTTTKDDDGSRTQNQMILHTILSKCVSSPLSHTAHVRMDESILRKCKNNYTGIDSSHEIHRMNRSNSTQQRININNKNLFINYKSI